MNFFSLSLSVFLSATVTWLAVRFLRPLAGHIGLVDTPGGRKIHADPVPLIGGVAVFIGFSFALLSLNTSLAPYRGLLAGVVLLVFIGVLDDFHELTARTRLMGQCVAAALFIEWGNVFFHHLGDLFFFGDVGLGVFSIAVTILFILAFINAVNMIDGADGLAGGVLFTQAALLAALSFYVHQPQNAALLLVLMAGVLVFLKFNLSVKNQSDKKIFLGDAGSTFLGAIIAWVAITLSQTLLGLNPPLLGYNLMTVLWIIAYPLFDLLSVIFLRIGKRKSPFSGGHEHLHFLLIHSKIQPRVVSLLLVLFSVFLGAVGFFCASLHMRESWQLLVFVMFFFSYLLVTLFLHARMPR